MKLREYRQELRSKQQKNVFGNTPKNDEDLNNYIQNMVNDGVIDTLLILTSLLASLSFAFFIGLLSVNSAVIESSTSIKIAIFLISISLSLNTLFSLIIFHSKNRSDSQGIHVLCITLTKSYIRILYGISMFSLPLGFLFLIYYFSPFIFIFSFIFICILLFLWNKAEEDSRQVFKKLNLLNNKTQESNDQN
ncbi:MULTISPECIES: hypothetical protein [Providencia]|uniref:hypothetical protein n=1 Tax=Providencia TaxID=586 RepID=UPI000C7F1D40|nr:hypothetical protein [Providencia huaxiensis]AXH61147.1 hypothetical protein CYG50_03420 [Providencia huaxiensis]